MLLAYSACFCVAQSTDQVVVCNGLLRPYGYLIVSRKKVPASLICRVNLGTTSTWKRLDSANHLAIDSKGNVYATDIVDNCVRKLLNKKKDAMICVPASGGIMRPHRLHLSESLGCLYIAESGLNGRVWAFRVAFFK